MVVVLVLGASGMLAAWTRPLTALALARTAAVPRKPLREIIDYPPSSTSAGVAASYGHRVCSFISVARSAAAGDRRLKVDSCEPEITLRLDRGDGRGNALARLRKQRKDVDQHRVVAKQRFVGDDLAQRQDLTLIMARDVVGRAIDAVGTACFGARVDGQFEQPIDGLHIRRLSLPHADLAEIEYWDLQSDIEAAHEIAFIHALFQLIGVAGVENVDESAGLGESVGLREHVELDAGDL